MQIFFRSFHAAWQSSSDNTELGSDKGGFFCPPSTGVPLATAQRTRRRMPQPSSSTRTYAFHVNVPPLLREATRQATHLFSPRAAFERCTPFREPYNSTARGSGCRASEESDPAGGRGAMYREDVTGRRRGRTAEWEVVFGSRPDYRPSSVMLYTVLVFSTLSWCRHHRRRKDRTGTRPDTLHTDTVTQSVTHSLAHTRRRRREPLQRLYIDAMHIAPNATEPRGAGGDERRLGYS